MTEKLTGYGYFSSIANLLRAVDARGRDKSGHAVVYEGAQIISDEKGIRVEGKPDRIFNVRVSPDGTLDIRATDSWDNE